MKTKTIHTVAIVVLSGMAIINLYADHKDSQLLFKYQKQYIQNQSEKQETLITLPAVLDAVNNNQKAVETLLKTSSTTHEQLSDVYSNIVELWKVVNVLLETENTRLSKTGHKTKSPYISNAMIPPAATCNDPGCKISPPLF